MLVFDRLPLCGAVALVLVLATGCAREGPDIARVEGTVRLDGKPLPDAFLEFQPTEGRPSVGRTDSSGYYELIYSRSQKGARVGEHVVSISTHQKGDRESGVEAVPEKVPAKYNSRSELKKMVEPDDNMIDFDLKSDGKIETPKDE